MFTIPITLFNVSTGVVETFYRPVSRAGSMGVVQTNAYDNTAGAFPGITTTTCSMTSSGVNASTKYETYTFSGATAYTKFKVYLTCDWAAYIGYDYISDPYQGIVAFQYSLNAGTSWAGTQWLSANDLVTESGSYTYAIPFDLGTLASTTITNFMVRVSVRSSGYDIDGEGISFAYAQGQIVMRDIYIGAS